MSSFSGLKASQKLLVGGFVGTCCGIFVLNGASVDLQRRRLKAVNTLIQTRDASSREFYFKDGQLVIPPHLQKADPSLAPSPFLDNTWNRKFIEENLTTNRANINEGRWYTLLTSGFNHASLGHLAFNMLAFSSIAPLFIGTLGTSTFLGVWIASGLTGGIASILDANRKLRKASRGESLNTMEAQKYMHMNYVGASTSIFGLFAATAMLYPQSRWQIMFIPYGIQARTLLGVTLAGSIVADTTGLIPSVGHWGHIGGMVSGAIIGSILKNRSTGGRIAMFVAFTCSGLGPSAEYHQKEPVQGI